MPLFLLLIPLNDELLNPTIRLLRTLDNPADRVILGESILEEIYYRLILNDHVGSLKQLLQHRGQVTQTSRAVEHIHRNLNEPVSLEELAILYEYFHLPQNLQGSDAYATATVC
jgi:hypothetical protein